MWKERYLRFSGDGAPCLEAAAGDEILYYLVEFTVNGDPVGGLTRVRCNSGDCHVAGVDN